MTINKLAKIVESSSVAKNELKPEILSIQAVVALGRSNTPQAYQTLLEVVKNENALSSVRIMALESFYTVPESVKEDVINTLQQVAIDIPGSTSLDRIDQNRFSTRIEKILKSLSKEQ